MAVVIALQGTSAVDVTVGLSPLAELMSCLHALVEPEHHPETRPWLRLVRTNMPAELHSSLESYAPLWARRRCRLLLPPGLPLGQSLPDELDLLRRMPLDLFTDTAAEAVHGADFDTVGLLADPARHDAYVAACERRSFRRGELARKLVSDPEGTRAGLLDLLTRCAADFFDTEWVRVRNRLETECARTRATLRTLSLPEALASLSPNAVVRTDPPAVVFDKLQPLRVDLRGRRCLLVPSAHVWPHLIVKDNLGFPVVVHFPVGNAGQANTAALAQVRLRLAILADPARLALCRHLVNESITTSELARRTGMTRPQVSRHLTRLREADLLISRRDGRLVHHRLDVQRLKQLGVDVLTAIVR
jgi:DNA-binding transcriptional ArsR family regulator